MASEWSLERDVPNQRTYQDPNSEWELFMCNLFMLVNDSDELKKGNFGWVWGPNRDFIRLEKTVKKGPMFLTHYNNYGDWMYPLVYRYDVVWDRFSRGPLLAFNLFDRDGKIVRMKSISSLLGIPLYLSSLEETTLDVMMHPIDFTPIVFLSGMNIKEKGNWLGVKNPVLAYLLKYGPYFNLLPQDLLELSNETPYLE